MSTADTLVMGLTEMSFGDCSKRDPVTTTSSTGGGVAGAAACAYTSEGAAVAAHAARAKRTAFRTLRLEFDIRFTPLERIWLCSRRWHEPPKHRRLRRTRRVSYCLNATQGRRRLQRIRASWQGFHPHSTLEHPFVSSAQQPIRVSVMEP